MKYKKNRTSKMTLTKKYQVVVICIIADIFCANRLNSHINNDMRCNVLCVCFECVHVIIYVRMMTASALRFECFEVFSCCSSSSFVVYEFSCSASCLFVFVLLAC